MLSGAIAAQLRSRRHDVVAAVEDRSMTALSDEEMLAAAATTGRALVTANIKDFVPLDQRYRAAGRSHAGLVLVSSKAFPRDRTFIGTVVVALDKLLKDQALRIDTVVFLQRPEPADHPTGSTQGVSTGHRIDSSQLDPADEPPSRVVQDSDSSRAPHRSHMSSALSKTSHQPQPVDIGSPTGYNR